MDLADKAKFELIQTEGLNLRQLMLETKWKKCINLLICGQELRRRLLINLEKEQFDYHHLHCLVYTRMHICIPIHTHTRGFRRY